MRYLYQEGVEAGRDYALVVADLKLGEEAASVAPSKRTFIADDGTPTMCSACWRLPPETSSTCRSDDRPARSPRRTVARSYRGRPSIEAWPEGLRHAEFADVMRCDGQRSLSGVLGALGKRVTARRVSRTADLAPGSCYSRRMVGTALPILVAAIEALPELEAEKPFVWGEFGFRVDERRMAKSYNDTPERLLRVSEVAAG